MLRPTREHAVGLSSDTSRHQIVDEHARVGLIASEDHRLSAASRDTGDQTLCGGLFISARPVDLAREEQPWDALVLKTVVEVARVREVILHGVAMLKNLRLLEPSNGPNHGQLHIRRQAGRQSVHIDPCVLRPSGSRKSWCRSRSAKRTILSSMLGQ